MLILTTTTTAPAAASSLTGLLPLGLLVIVGLILWFAGRRVLRVGFAAAGLLLGAGAGWMLADAMDLGVSPWLVSLVLGVVTACVAALAYRIPVAAAMAVVCGVGAGMIVVTAGEFHDRRSDEPSAPLPADRAEDFARDTVEMIDEASDWLFAQGDAVPAAPELTPESIAEALETLDQMDARESNEDGAIPAGLMPGDPVEHVVTDVMSRLDERNQERVERARGWLGDARERAMGWWSTIPQSRRPRIAITAAIGAIIGLLVGTIAPGFCSTLVTGFGGALLWLSGARILLTEFGGTGVGRFLPDSTTLNLVMWVIISLIGIAIQWTFRAKPTDTPG